MSPLVVPIIVALIGLVGIIFTGVVSWKTGARNARIHEREAGAEAQKSVNEAFSALVKTLQDERKEMRDERKEMRHEIAGLKTEVQALYTYVSQLETEVVRMGGTTPPRPIHMTKVA